MREDVPIRNLVLTGFMGCGKTTVGRLIARHVGWRFLDMDRLIERRLGMSVPMIFRRKGERAFRLAEHRAIRSLLGTRRRVIAVGGGAPVQVMNRGVLKRLGLSVYVKVSSVVLARRLAGSTGRPLLAPALVRPGNRRRNLRALIDRLLRQREADYRRADVCVNAGELRARPVARKIEAAIGINVSPRRS